MSSVAEPRVCAGVGHIPQNSVKGEVKGDLYLEKEHALVFHCDTGQSTQIAFHIDFS